MSRVRKSRPMPNGGIVARNIRAEAIAVGPKATAIVKKQVNTARNEEVHRAIVELRRYVQTLDLRVDTHAGLEHDLATLQRAAQADTPDPEEVQGALEGFAEKLKMVGVVVKEAVGLIEPIKTIATIVGVGLAALTL